jgi:Glycosyl transferase family 2
VSGPPRLSVLLPLQDQRETAVASFRAWRDQTVDPATYEIIVLAPGEDADMEDAVRPLLREEDSWIARPGRDEYELFDIGADAARGEYLFLTEAHCVPEPDCLEAMFEELERTGAPGVRGESVPDVRGPLGELELEMFDEAQKREEDPEHWRKVLIHSLAMRRDVFLEAGGTPSRYGDFCTWVLAIQLDRAGIRMAYSSRPRVSHTYDGDLEHVVPFVRSFRRGEVLYRTERPAEAVNGYLEWVPEWERRLAYTRSGAWGAVRAAFALRHRGALMEVPRHLSATVFGPRVEMARARARARAAARRTRNGGEPDRLRKPFRDFWAQNSRLGVFEGLLETKPPPAEPAAAEAHLDLTESWAGRAIGLHDLDDVRDEPPFRWTAPLALLRVAVPGTGRARARLHLRPFDRPQNAPAKPRVAVDNRRVPIRTSDDLIEFEVDAGERWISIACNPLRPRRYGVDDPRALGLPVRALSFESSGSQTAR